MFYMEPKATSLSLKQPTLNHFLDKIKIRSSSRVSKVNCKIVSQFLVSAFENNLTLRLLCHIYMEHPFLMFLDHTQRRTTVGRTPLDE